MSKTSIKRETVACALSAHSLFSESGHEIIQEMLLSCDFAGVSIGKEGGRYYVEAKTRDEYQHIMRKYIAALPGSLSKGFEDESGDMASIKKWLGEGYTILLISLEDFVRAYRYKQI